MDAKKLKRLSREDLLELILEETKRYDELEAKLNEKTIKIEKAGSIAEAALEINHIFEDAQKAADQYVESIKQIYEEANAQLESIKAQIAKAKKEEA
ncbi:MAG: hypothetical protein IJ875_05130 [Solobacterium sp.]|nr:hypothetical protein [Solobacterium sp.]